VAFRLLIGQLDMIHAFSSLSTYCAGFAMSAVRAADSIARFARNNCINNAALRHS
jgi:hypothetical protein